MKRLLIPILVAALAPAAFAATRSVPSQYSTVQAAVNAAASGDTISIANGTYTEQVNIPSGKNSLKIVGASQSGVILTAGLNQKAMVVNANDTTFSYLTIRNTAGLTAGNTSNAVFVYGSRTQFYRCYLLGSQDTIYLGGGPNYFALSEIRGSVDFIYGGSASYFTSCDIIQVRPTGGPATAPNTAQTQTYGFVFSDCYIGSLSGVAAGSSTLMRPWGPYGQSVFINCKMDASISAAGWSAWSGREATCRAYEYGSKTPAGATINLASRAPWVKRLTATEAATYSKNNVLGGWVPSLSGGGGGTVADGTYRIIARHSGLGLDVTASGTANGTNVQQWNYSGGNNQRWIVTNLGNGEYRISPVHASDKGLDVVDSSTSNGANVQIWNHVGSSNQKWILTATSGGYFRISPAHASDKALDVVDSSTSNGANVQIWNYVGSDNQQFSFQAP